jgi:type I restriction enzyme S subunit
MKWDTVQISQFCKTGTGGTPSRSDMERFYANGTIPWVKSGELRENIISETSEHVTDAALRETSIKLVPAGALLLALYGATVGRLGILGVEATTNQAVCHIIPDPKKANVRYLFHALSNQVPNLIARGVGGAQPNISQGIVKELALMLPPLAEQKRIAAILDAADALRAKRREALAQLDALLQSSFLTLFGDPVTNPMGWVLHSLKELGKVKTGGTPPSAKTGMFDGPIPFITPGDLGSGRPAKRTVTEAGAAEAEIVRAGTTLVCCIGATIGKMGKAEVRSSFNQQINAIEWSKNVDDEYGLGVLTFFKAQIAKAGASTTLPILKKSSFEKLTVPLPPLPLQQKFAAIVESIERQKATQRAHLPYQRRQPGFEYRDCNHHHQYGHGRSSGQRQLRIGHHRLDSDGKPRHRHGLALCRDPRLQTCLIQRRKPDAQRHHFPILRHRGGTNL